MAVAHSAASESHTGTIGSTSQASFSWTHTQTGTPQGVLVFVHVANSAGNPVSSVTYGSVTLTRVPGGAAVDSAGEAGRTDLFFAGSGLPTGNQTITVNRANTTDIMYASAATVTAATNTNVTGIVLLQGDGALTVQSVDDGSPGSNSLRYAAAYSGLAAPPPAGTGSTLLNSIDFGNYGIALVRETTAGQGARNVGFNNATTDDRAVVHVAVRELFNRTETPIVGAFTLTGNNAALAKVVPSLLNAETGTLALTGQPATLTKGKVPLAANTGSLAVTGQPASLKVDHKITGGTGQFSLVGSDPYYNTVSLLLHFDGANGSTRFVDDGPNQFTPTINGNAQISTAQSVFGGSSALFDGTGDFLSYATNSVFTYAGDFTFEFRVYINVMQRSGIIANGAASFSGSAAVVVLNHPNDANKIGIWNAPTSGAAICTTNTLSIGTWYHIAFVRSGTTLTCYQNGVAISSATATGSFQMSATSLKLGSYWGGDFSGYLEELRLEPIARYGSNFTVSSLPLLGQNPFLTVGWALNADTGAFTLTGQQATTRHNVRIEAGTGAFSLTGNDATLSEATPKAITAETGAFALSGNAATARRGYSLSAEAGAFTAAGQAATLRHNPRIEASTGSFALSGGSPALLRGRYLSGGAGEFIETGQPATFRRTWAIQAATGGFTFTGRPAALTELGAYEIDPTVGSFSLSGQPANLAQSQTMPVTAGAFSLTGQSATLRQSQALSAATGSFATTGQPAALKQGYRLDANTGAFGFTGQPATLAKQSAKQLSASTGAFALVGQPAALTTTRALSADRGLFTLTGQPAALLHSPTLRADAGLFSLVGRPADARAAHRLTAEPGAFNFTGNGAALTEAGDIQFLVGAGVFAFTGQPVSLAKASTARRRNVLIF